MLLAGALLPLATMVSFAAPAAPASRLLPELGKSIGLVLKADARLSREVLLVRVREVSRDDLLRHLAEVTQGAWEKDGEALRLTLSGATQARQRQTEAKARGEMWKAGLATRIKQYATLTNSGAPSGLPETVLTRLPSELLGGLTLRQRIVFSTQPTAMQRPMPSGALQSLDLSRLRHMERYDQNGQPLPAPGPMALALFVVQLDPSQLWPTGTLITADASGRVIGAETAMTFGGQPLSESSASVLPRPDATLKLSDPLTALAAAVGTVDRIDGRGGSISDERNGGPGQMLYSAEELAAAPSKAVDAAFLYPATHEPLAAFPGAPLTQLAEAEKLNMVALLPDDAFAPTAGLFAHGEVRANDFERASRSQADLDLRVEGGWLFAVPHRPDAARSARADRTALGTVLKTLAASHDLTLSAQADYAAAQPLASPGESIEGPVIALVNLGWARRLALSSAMGERSLLRAYRALNGRIGAESRPFGSLPAEARAALTDLVFNARYGPTTLERVALPNGGTQAVERFGNDLLFAESLATERTILLARGIPTDAQFRLLSGSKEAYLGISPSGLRPALTGEGSGVSLSRRGNEPMRVATNSPRLDAYLPGSIESKTFSVAVPGVWSFDRTLYETRVKPNAVPVAFSALPQQFQDQVASGEKSVVDAVQRVNEHRTRPLAKP